MILVLLGIRFVFHENEEHDCDSDVSTLDLCNHSKLFRTELDISPSCASYR